MICYSAIAAVAGTAQLLPTWKSKHGLPYVPVSLSHSSKRLDWQHLGYIVLVDCASSFS